MCVNEMKFTPINDQIQKRLVNEVSTFGPIARIVQALHEANGRAFLVGGAVRDLLLDLPIKDLDIEVHGLQPAELEKILRTFGYVDLVGKAFGVYRVQGIDVDFALPRKDEGGRKPEVAIDPNMDLRDAFARRDLTINAMGIDLITFELVDPFDGQKDLAAKVLRPPDIRFFTEDPLRFFRVMQFIGRFEMNPSNELNHVCISMDISQVSIERIEAEFEKLLLQSKRPSLGIRWLRLIGRLKEILPEVAALIDCEQHPEWHPEGDVFEHTMQTLDAAAQFEYTNEEDKLIMMYAALCHDLGKVSTTRGTGRTVTSYGHELDGVPLAQSLMMRVTGKKDLIKWVGLMVRHHMTPGLFVKDGAKPAAYKRLARKMAPRLNLALLADLAVADKRGRNAQGNEPLDTVFEDIAQFRVHAHEAHVEFSMEPPVLLGRDLLDVIKPGPELGKLLERAYEIQIDEGIVDRDELKRRVAPGSKA